MKEILKVAKTTIDVALGLVGLSFVAGTVAGSIITGKEGNVRFSINEHQIVDDYMNKYYPWKHDEEETSEPNEEEPDD